MKARKENGLYKVKVQVRPVFEEEHSKPIHRQGTENAHVASSVSMDTWHKRLGHLSEKGMKVLADGNNSKNLIFQNQDIMSGSCVSCLTGKMPKASFPTVGSSH